MIRCACAVCGESFKASRLRLNCSVRCEYVQWHKRHGDAWNQRRRERRLAKKAALGRVCKGCGEQVPPERNSQAQYCSEKCRVGLKPVSKNRAKNRAKYRDHNRAYNRNYYLRQRAIVLAVKELGLIKEV